MSACFKKILIIKPSSLGDIVLALPALTALREKFPDAKISWLVRPEFAPLIEGHPHLDEIISFDRRFLGQALFNPMALKALVLLIKCLRRARFDGVFDFQGLFRTASLSWLSGCPRRFGIDRAREMAHFFYSDPVLQTDDCIHLVDYYLKITKTVGALDTPVQFILPQSDSAQEAVGKLLADQELQGRDYIVFVPGSAHVDKCWPTENFSRLAEKISERFNAGVLAVGSRGEAAEIDRLKNASEVPVVNLAGRTSLKELVAILRGAKAVVSNDTGPGHIAAALGRPLVMIFGRSNPSRVAPYGRAESVVAVEPFGRGSVINSMDPKYDVRHITVEQVYARLCQQLDA